MSGRDHVGSLDDELPIEELKDAIFAEEGRGQAVVDEEHLNIAEKKGLILCFKDAILQPADQNDNCVSGFIDSRELVDEKATRSQSIEDKGYSNRVCSKFEEDVEAFEDTRKSLEDTESMKDTLDAGNRKENRAGFTELVNSKDGGSINDELDCNQLLPDNEARDSDINLGEVCTAALAEKLGACDREAYIGSCLEPNESDFANVPANSMGYGEKRGSYDDTLKVGKKDSFNRDHAFEMNTHSEKFQAGNSCNKSERNLTSSNSLDGFPTTYGDEEVEGEAVVREEMADVNVESDRENETSSPLGNSVRSKVNVSSTIEDEIESFDSKVKDDLDEDESEYHSVTSYKYSSFESLDDAKAHGNNPPRGDPFPGSRIEREATTRGILGSETDRTDDDYVTCDEQSIVDGLADDYDDDIELERCNTEHAPRASGRLLNEFDGGCHDDNGDYEGHDTQDYLAADEQSELDGAPQCVNNIEDKEEEYADDLAKEKDDERSTIVGSDDELEDTSKENGHESDISRTDKPGDSDILNKDNEGMTEKDEEKSYQCEKIEDDLVEKGNRINEEESTDDFSVDGNEKKPVRRKKSFFSTMMAKKEMKITEKVFSYNQQYEIAIESIAQANARFKKAKSDLPLLIVEQRIPKIEELQRKTDKLEQLETRLDSYIAYNRSANAYIQNWRTMESHIHNKKAEFQTFRTKTSERQQLLMACKKRQSFLHSELTRHDDLQLRKKRKIKQLKDRLDMLQLRQTEQRNLVKKRIDEAKKYCELSVREAAKVVVVDKRVNALKAKEKELEDRVFKIKKEMKKVKQMRKEKEFEVERANIQKSVKAMKKERGW